MINIIVACDQNMAIGNQGELLCHLPGDLAYFKDKTKGSIVIQGRKTYESIVNKLGHPLINRTNIVLTKDASYNPADYETHVYHSVEDVLREYHEYGEGQSDVFVIGGGEIYKQFLPHSDKVYMTLIQHKFDKADTSFPRLDDTWKVTENTYKWSDQNNPYDYNFLVYTHK